MAGAAEEEAKRRRELGQEIQARGEEVKFLEAQQQLVLSKADEKLIAKAKLAIQNMDLALCFVGEAMGRHTNYAKVLVGMLNRANLHSWSLKVNSQSQDVTLCEKLGPRVVMSLTNTEFPELANEFYDRGLAHVPIATEGALAIIRKYFLVQFALQG